MERNDEAASGLRGADVASAAAAATMVGLDAIEPTENDRDKTTEVAAALAAVTLDDGDAAATPAEAEQDGRTTARGDGGGGDDEDDKTAESEAAAAAAAAANEEPVVFVFPFGEPVPNQGSLMPPPGQRRTRPTVVKLCVNLHEMREARTVYPADADQTTPAAAAAALTATTTTTTTATAPVAVSEGASTSTTSAVAPIQRSRCSNKPVSRSFIYRLSRPFVPGWGFFSERSDVGRALLPVHQTRLDRQDDLVSSCLRRRTTINSLCDNQTRSSSLFDHAYRVVFSYPLFCWLGFFSVVL